MKALRNATAALALTILLMVAGHADAGDTHATRPSTADNNEVQFLQDPGSFPKGD